MTAAADIPTDAEVEAAVDVLRRAGWSVMTLTLNGRLARGKLVRTDPRPIPGYHEAHESRRVAEPYRPVDRTRAAS